MKFFAPLALAAAAVVSAQDKSCAADNIVTSCLASEQAKINACGPADYDCLCAAYEAVATCYNNCPNDPRASPARGQVTVYCQNASIHGSRALASKTATAAVTRSATDSVSTASGSPTTTQNKAMSTTASSSTSKPTSTGAAQALGGSPGGVFMAVAGVVAALL